MKGSILGMYLGVGTRENLRNRESKKEIKIIFLQKFTPLKHVFFININNNKSKVRWK